MRFDGASRNKQQLGYLLCAFLLEQESQNLSLSETKANRCRIGVYDFFRKLSCQGFIADRFHCNLVNKETCRNNNKICGNNYLGDAFANIAASNRAASY